MTTTNISTTERAVYDRLIELGDKQEPVTRDEISAIAILALETQNATTSASFSLAANRVTVLTTEDSLDRSFLHMNLQESPVSPFPQTPDLSNEIPPFNIGTTELRPNMPLARVMLKLVKSAMNTTESRVQQQRHEHAWLRNERIANARLEWARKEDAKSIPARCCRDILETRRGRALQFQWDDLNILSYLIGRGKPNDRILTLSILRGEIPGLSIDMVPDSLLLVTIQRAFELKWHEVIDAMLPPEIYYA